MPSNQGSPRPKNALDEPTTKIKRTSPYDRNFEQHLIDNGIYPNHYAFPDDRDPPQPSNRDEIRNRLNQRRPSLSSSNFSEQEFYIFGRTASRALNEDAVMGNLLPIIQGHAPIPSAKNLLFGNLIPLTNSNLTDAKPDFYDGVNPFQIAQPIREELGRYIIPSKQTQAPALPNFFMEAKGPYGIPAVGKLQACFDGALGARGVHKLRSFRENPDTLFDHNAYSVTTFYNDGNLKIFSSHPARPLDPEDPPEFHMTQLGGWDLTGSYDQFRQGASALRNARDWAKEQRDQLVAAANSRVIGIPRETSISAPSIHSISESTIDPEVEASKRSVDELSEDVNTGPGYSNKRLKTVS